MSNSTTSNEKYGCLRVLASTLAGIAICNGVGGATALAAGSGESEWYRSLEKPDWTPPGKVIGTIWTVLYTLMGISLSIVWRARDKNPNAGPALQLFTVQLLLNSLWTFLFFRWKNPRAAFIEILVLIAAIAMTIFVTWKVSKPAALLLVPYLAWTTFAAYLNYTIAKMNPKTEDQLEPGQG